MLILGLRENRPIEITTPDGTRILLTRLYQLGKGLQLGLELPVEYRVRVLKSRTPAPERDAAFTHATTAPD